MSNAEQLKAFFLSKGWTENRSAKYLHKDVDGKKYRIAFSQMAFRIEMATPHIGANRWYNLRSAYYKDVSVGEHLFFEKHNNDIFHELNVGSKLERLFQTLF